MDTSKEVILFEDECNIKSNPTLTTKWSLKGQQPEIKTYSGYKSKNIFGTVNLKNGDLIYRFASVQNQEEFIKHLKQIIRKYFNKNTFIYLDNAGWHKGKKVKEFLKNHSNIHLIFLPPYSPKLNPVERFWKFMRKNITHNHFYELISEFDNAVFKFFKSTQRKRIKKKIRLVCRNI